MRDENVRKRDEKARMDQLMRDENARKRDENARIEKIRRIRECKIPPILSTAK